MATGSPAFVPALGHDWLTPLYDVVARLTGDRRFKRHLVTLARLAPGHAVLDLGCGTGTLALIAQAACPQARITGLDIDPRILAIARRKVARAGAPIALCEGSATDPPFAAASFDRILTTLMLHHLTTAQKRAALAAVRRLLRPGGELHVADFGPPHNALMRLLSHTVHRVDGRDATRANLAGELPALLAEAGLRAVRESAPPWMTPFGSLAFTAATA